MLGRHIRYVRFPIAAVAAVGLVLAATPAFAAISNTPSSTWGTNGRVKAIVSSGGNNIIAGSFTQVTDTSGHSFAAGHVAQISGSSGVVNRSWSGTTNGDVYALAVLGSTLYIGGDFTQVDGVAHQNLAAVNLATGALLTTFRATANKPVDALTAAAGVLIAGGRFSKITDGAGTTSRSFLAKLDATSGLVDQGWSPKPELRVRTVAISSSAGTVYAGGDFTTINGVTTHSIVALSGTGAGSVIGSFNPGATNGNQFAPVYGTDLVGSTLYLAVGGGGGACTALSATTGARIWTKHTNGNLQAVTLVGGVVYCGGHFGGVGSFGGEERYHLAGVNATAPYAVTSFAPHPNSALGIWSLAQDSSHLFVGGDFTAIGTAKRAHYAAFAVS